MLICLFLQCQFISIRYVYCRVLPGALIKSLRALRARRSIFAESVSSGQTVGELVPWMASGFFETAETGEPWRIIGQKGSWIVFWYVLVCFGSGSWGPFHSDPLVHWKLEQAWLEAPETKCRGWEHGNQNVGWSLLRYQNKNKKSSNERTLKSDHFLRRPFLTNVSTRSECVDACYFFNMYQNSLALRRFATK